MKQIEFDDLFEAKTKVVRDFGFNCDKAYPRAQLTIEAKSNAVFDMEMMTDLIISMIRKAFSNAQISEYRNIGRNETIVWLYGKPLCVILRIEKSFNVNVTTKSKLSAMCAIMKKVMKVNEVKVKFL